MVAIDHSHRRAVLMSWSSVSSVCSCSQIEWLRQSHINNAFRLSQSSASAKFGQTAATSRQNFGE